MLNTPQKNRFSGRVLLILSALILCLMTAGCGKQKEHENLQDDNNVAGFLFHFDQRAETLRLIGYKNRGQLPVSVSWNYPNKMKHTVIDTAGDGGSTASAAEVEEISEKQGSEEKSFISTDDNQIIEIYNSLNNVIVVGSSYNTTKRMAYYIIFTLNDGSTCTYEFPSENTIHIGDHNYAIESDGNLWALLKSYGDAQKEE